MQKHLINISIIVATVIKDNISFEQHQSSSDDQQLSDFRKFSYATGGINFLCRALSCPKQGMVERLLSLNMFC